MAKPNRVRFDTAAVYFNGYIVSRVQSVDASSDLGEEEVRELSNAEIVEATSTNPQVTFTIETNDYGSCRNLRAAAGVTGGVNGNAITLDSFENTICDIGIVLSPDGVLGRTGISNNCFLTSLSWSFDVGGVATETYTFETDNFEFMQQAKRQGFSIIGVNPLHAAGGSGHVHVGTVLSGYTVETIYIDGIEPTGITFESTTAAGFTRVGFFDRNITSTGTNYRVVIYKDTPSTTIEQRTSAGTSAIGSIPRGKINIYLSSGTSGNLTTELDALTQTNLLRMQSVNIDADLSREQLDQLGNYRSYFRSLVRPVPVNITMSANASDLEEWEKFSNLVPGSTSNTNLNITAFVKNAALKVEYFDKQDIDLTRVKIKTLVFSGLQVVGTTFNVDAGGIGTHDFTVKGSNILASGRGILGRDPLDTTVPTD